VSVHCCASPSMNACPAAASGRSGAGPVQAHVAASVEAHPQGRGSRQPSSRSSCSGSSGSDGRKGAAGSSSVEISGNDAGPP